MASTSTQVTVSEETSNKSGPRTFLQAHPRDDYSPKYITTYVNYWRDGPSPPSDPSTSNFSTHDLRIQRRKEDSPNVARTLVRINNLRGHEANFTLSEQGFQICRLDSALGDWNDQNALKKVYFSEVANVLKRLTGARYVYSYEHHIRRKTLGEALKIPTTEGEVDIDGPVRRVHIDETPRSARNEFNYYLPEWAPAALRGSWKGEGMPHFGIYNIWKPLKTVRRDPLCLCDVRSLQEEDLKPGAVTVPNMGEIENYAIRPPVQEGKHKFHYLKGQSESEALVFRIYDSRDEGEDGKLKQFGVAHTSFVDPETETFDEARESVEVRSFCVF